MLHRTTCTYFEQKTRCACETRPLSTQSLIGYFISHDPGQTLVFFYVFFGGGGGGLVKFRWKWCSNCRTIKSDTVNRGKGGHLYLQINMKNTKLDFKYFSVYAKLLHKSRSCVQIGNDCDNLCWTWSLENSKWFQSLNIAWQHVYIYLL